MEEFVKSVSNEDSSLSNPVTNYGARRLDSESNEIESLRDKGQNFRYDS